MREEEEEEGEEGSRRGQWPGGRRRGEEEVMRCLEKSTLAHSSMALEWPKSHVKLEG